MGHLPIFPSLLSELSFVFGSFPISHEMLLKDLLVNDLFRR